MKNRISVTIEEELDRKIDSMLKDRKYRNKSHIVEIALEEFVKRGGRKW